MPAQVLIAHTGQRLDVDMEPLTSLDDLKTWVAGNSSLSAQHMVALTPQGRSIRPAGLLLEGEICVYDMRVTQLSPSPGKEAPVLDSEAPLPRPLSLPEAPNTVDDVQNISSWQHLYAERRSWALRLAEDCALMKSASLARRDEMEVITKCLDAAVANLEMSVKQIEPKYSDLKKWMEPALEDNQRLVSGWENYLSLALKTPVSPSVITFMTRGEVSKTAVTLHDLVKLETAEKMGKLAPVAHRNFSDKATKLDSLASQMYQSFRRLVADLDELMGRSLVARNNDPTQLLLDVEKIASQIDADYRTALAYSGSQRELALASKMAANHTEKLVPLLQRLAQEMDEVVRQATKARNSIARDSLRFMRVITDITALHSSLKSQIGVLNQSEDDMAPFDYLRLIHQLPYMYASFVVESIRRREWFDKVKADSSTLANEMALFQEEEAKRRKKWQKSIGGTFGPEPVLDTSVVGLEVNLLGEDAPWPAVSKADLDSFLQTLQDLEADRVVVNDVEKLMQDLNSPTKQQSRRLRACKHGSLDEAALGRSGLLLRGDDELLRSLQKEKNKLESKLKTADSRVRRLEDLLHRQGQVSRRSLFFPTSDSPLEEKQSTSMTSAVALGRPQDELPSSDDIGRLSKRIRELEIELGEEKQRSAQLEVELNAGTALQEEMKEKIDEVNSTKKDLLGNMEALEREFQEERKSLEGEMKVLKMRLEDAEDEMEQIGESRDNEKVASDEKAQALEAEVERLMKGRNEEALRSQGQVDYLRKETQMQREQLGMLERQVQTVTDEKRTMSKKLEAAQERVESQAGCLKTVHQELAPEVPVPSDLMDLVESLPSQAAQLWAKFRKGESDLTLARAELEQALLSKEELGAEISRWKDRLSKEEEDSRRLRESLGEEQAKVGALEREVSEGREQLRQTRIQLSDGEMGSESLQKKIEAEEEKVAKMSEEMASRQSQVGSLEAELAAVRQKWQGVEKEMSSLKGRYELRDERTKSLTHRLYAQHEGLRRLLERIGYTMSREGGKMAITKLSRSERGAVNGGELVEAASSAGRWPSLGARGPGEKTDLELLQWTSGVEESGEAERFDHFLQSFGSLDMELVAETVYVRIKEAEHKARKWQREARAYRDRGHGWQKEAQEKIAFRQFKEGDLALFLPTRNQQAGAWAAFNVGCPHYFLREQEGHRLGQREWLVARISRIQERVVDLSKSLGSGAEWESMNEEEKENPFQLSDGLRWYLIDAYEDKTGAPATPGMGKSTVAAHKVEARADIQSQVSKGQGRKKRDSVASMEDINKSLSKSLDSRRSSSGSKKTLPWPAGAGLGALRGGGDVVSDTSSLRVAAAETPAGTSPVQPGGSMGEGEASTSEARWGARAGGGAGGGTGGGAGGQGEGGGEEEAGGGGRRRGREAGGWADGTGDEMGDERPSAGGGGEQDSEVGYGDLDPGGGC